MNIDKIYGDAMLEAEQKAVESFKSALREQVEKEIKKMPEAEFHREVSGLKRVLQLIKTITPKQ